MAAAVRPVRLPDESARAYIYRVLLLYIHEMAFLPGEKLVEADIAARLGVSRTPVHSAIRQLEQEKQLLPGSRGAVVPPLCIEAIRQQLWMHRTVGEAVLGAIFGLRPGPAQLAPLEDILAQEYAMLDEGACPRSARLNREFLAALYRLAGFELAYSAINSGGSDLYRLYRLFEDHELWAFVARQHAGMLRALAGHDHESALAALNALYDLAAPLLGQSLQRYSQYIS